MKATFSLIAASAICLLTTAAFAASLNIVNSDFSAVPVLCGGGYAYQSSGGGNCGSAAPQQDFNGTSGFGWTFLTNAGNGLTRSGTAFNPPPNFPSAQVAFLQSDVSSVSQSISGFLAGTLYQLSFDLGSRFTNGGGVDGNQTVEALIDGNVIGTWALTSFTPFTLETANFTVNTSGSHTLEFIGTTPGDHTAFLTDVSVTSVPEFSTLSTVLTFGIFNLAAVVVVRRKLA